MSSFQHIPPLFLSTLASLSFSSFLFSSQHQINLYPLSCNITWQYDSPLSHMRPTLHPTPHSHKPGVNSHHILQACTPPLLVSLSPAVMSDCARKLNLAHKKSSVRGWCCCMLVGEVLHRGPRFMCCSNYMAQTDWMLHGEMKKQAQPFSGPTFTSCFARAEWKGGHKWKLKQCCRSSGLLREGTDCWAEASWSPYGDLFARI